MTIHRSYESYYQKAQQVRRCVKQDFDKVFKDVDLILTPTSPSDAYRERLHETCSRLSLNHPEILCRRTPIRQPST